MSRNHRFPILMLILASQIMLISSQSHNYGGASMTHDVMLEHFAACQANWKEATDTTIKEQLYRCPGETENRGTVYESYTKRWVAYAWGIDSKDFDTCEQAKRYIESQIAYWIRPKAPWWKPWKEFAYGPEKQP